MGWGGEDKWEEGAARGGVGVKVGSTSMTLRVRVRACFVRLSCERAFLRACVRAWGCVCVCLCVRACVRACVRVRACVVCMFVR